MLRATHERFFNMPLGAWMRTEIWQPDLCDPNPPVGTGIQSKTRHADPSRFRLRYSSKLLTASREMIPKICYIFVADEMLPGLPPVFSPSSTWLRFFFYSQRSNPVQRKHPCFTWPDLVVKIIPSDLQEQTEKPSNKISGHLMTRHFSRVLKFLLIEFHKTLRKDGIHLHNASDWDATRKQLQEDVQRIWSNFVYQPGQVWKPERDPFPISTINYFLGTYLELPQHFFHQNFHAFSALSALKWSPQSQNRGGKIVRS